MRSPLSGSFIPLGVDVYTFSIFDVYTFSISGDVFVNAR